MWTAWNNVKDACLDVLFPKRCPACGNLLEEGEETALCYQCMGAVVPTGQENACKKCGLPFATRTIPGHVCGECIKNPPPWDSARSIFVYKGPVRRLIHLVKFNEDGPALKALGIISRPLIQRLHLTFDKAVPVPLSRRRLMQRGFNQCVWLLKELFQGSRHLIDPFAIEKTRHTPHQTGLDRKERRKNLRRAFKAKAHRVKGKDVLLFDDVFTTGTTVREVSKVLRDAGARRIMVLTVARTVIHGDLVTGDLVSGF